MDNYSLFTLIKDHPRSSRKDIEEFLEDITEKFTDESTYSSYYSLWEIDTTSDKRIYNSICESRVPSKNSYVVGKTIVENKLILKLMGGDIPGAFVPELINNLFSVYCRRFTMDSKKRAEFYYFIINRLPISVVKKLYDSKTFRNLPSRYSEEFHGQLLDLLMQDINSDLINLMVDNYLHDEVDSNGHQMTIEEICDK